MTGVGRHALLTGLLVLIGMGACSQATPAAPSDTAAAVATSAVEVAKPIVTGVEGRFNPTEAVGGGGLSKAVTDIASAFSSVPQASQLNLSANASPAGAAGPDVQSISIVAQDKGGLLKGLDAAAKKSLGEALLEAAAAAWPNANVSLLVTDPAGGGGQIIGTRPKGGANLVIAT